MQKQHITGNIRTLVKGSTYPALLMTCWQQYKTTSYHVIESIFGHNSFSWAKVTKCQAYREVTHTRYAISISYPSQCSFSLEQIYGVSTCLREARDLFSSVAFNTSQPCCFVSSIVLGQYEQTVLDPSPQNSMVYLSLYCKIPLNRVDSWHEVFEVSVMWYHH